MPKSDIYHIYNVEENFNVILSTTAGQPNSDNLHSKFVFISQTKTTTKIERERKFRTKKERERKFRHEKKVASSN